jgi:hypothetical protein
MSYLVASRGDCGFRGVTFVPHLKAKDADQKIPRAKTLALLKKIKKYSALHRYDHLSPPTFIVCSKMLYNIHLVPLQVSLTLIIMPLLCSQVLINHGDYLRLRDSNIVHYFNDRHVLKFVLFDYLLTCIRHDDIVHKIDVVGYRILY